MLGTKVLDARMRYLLLIAAFQAAPMQPMKIPALDGCSGDPTFVEYRSRLAAVVDAKDVSALRMLVSPDILVDFGGGRGWLEFAKEWSLDRPNESPLWIELGKLLKLGCEVIDDWRVMPGNFSSLMSFDDPLPVYFAVKKGAVLRSKPDDSAPVVMTLDHHLLLISGEAAEDWLSARLTDGTSGYVRLSEVRSATDFRAGFDLRAGKWVMTSLVAGD